MALIETLKRIAVEPVGGRALDILFEMQWPQELGSKGAGRSDPGARPPPGQAPKVSCLLVTTGARSTLACAIECYNRQTYDHRELVVVTHPDGLAAVNRAVEDSGASNVAVHCVGRELTLGDCRNLAIARSTGQIIMQWDDDDLYDPLRIEAAVALMAGSDAVAVMLERVLVWWPQRRLAAVSMARLWEGSIAVWRDHAPAYPSLARGEDTVAVEFLSATRTVATYEATLLYVYVVHAGNTWDAPHFEEVIAQAQHVFQDADYDDVLRLVSARMPVDRYLAEMARDRAVHA